MKKTCGCCEGTEKLTPMVIANRPGLSALAYRAGTHAGFFETMKARLSNYYLDIPTETVDQNGQPQFDRLYPLQKLSTRAANDPAIALLDAWSTVGDVLTFYQERLANEGFLRTATERRSILELARLVGYSLRPGVASTVYLAYTLDNNFKEEVIIPAGARSQSVPGPGELPQTFETFEPLQARAAWNRLQPRMTQPQTKGSIAPSVGAPSVYLKGISTNLKPNDPLLIDFGVVSPPELFRILEVKPEAAADRTLVRLEAWITSTAIPGLRSIAMDVEATIKRFSAVADFDVSPTSEMTKRVLGHLNALRARSEEDLAEFIEKETLQRLVKEHHIAKESNFTNLAPWLGEMIAELNEIKQRAAAATTPVGKKDDAFDLNLQQLVLPPSVPPATKLRLLRNRDNEFALKGDAGLQLVAAFQTKLSDSLPVAVANAKVTPDNMIKVYALRVKASLFGHNAPLQPKLVPDTGEGGKEAQYTLTRPTMINTWGTLSTLGGGEKGIMNVVLDAVHDQIQPGSLVAIERPAVGEPKPKRVITIGSVDSVRSLSMDALGLATRVSVLTVHPLWLSSGDWAKVKDLSDFLPNTSVYAQSELLELAEEPIDTPICGGANSAIELDSLYNGLQSGRWLIIYGERTDIQAPDPNDPSQMVVVSGVKASELVMLAGVEQRFNPDLSGDKTHTFIRLSDALAYCYKRDTVAIYGNVAKATHGETRNEVLGSGEGSKALQTFALRQPPLTYVAATTPAGVESTLKVYVNDVQWHEAESFVALNPTDRHFITRTDDESKSAVIFGNGERGTRLPTGIENIKAVYRNGIGKPGNVKAEQISLLTTRPLGVKEVINPLPASGGADKESRDQARRNASLKVAALDRLVSTADYADFARSFAGIGKASAVRLSDGRRQIVHLTIAGADDIPIDKTSDLYRHLVQALREFGDPFQPFQVELRELVFLVISANVRLLPDYLWESVAPKIRQILLDTFSFERRELGQDVALSEVISAMHSVAGVAYVDVDTLRGVPEAMPETMADAANPGQRRLLTPAKILEKINQPLRDALRNILREPLARVAVNMADFENGAIRPAQLAYLTPAVEATLILNEVK